MSIPEKHMKFIFTLITSFFITYSSFSQLIPDFTVSKQEICAGESVQFTDLSTSSETITSWSWNFGDGNDSHDQNPSHTYTNPNSNGYTVTLVATDINGSESKVKTFLVKVNPLPTPSFEPNLIGDCSLPSSISIDNVQPNSGMSYNWDFGNGATSISANPGNITYNLVGNYDITLSVTD